MKTNKLKSIGKYFGIIVICCLVIFLLTDGIIMPFYVQQGKTTNVPDVIGLPLDVAKKRLQEVELAPKESEYKTDKRYKIGTVILQNPIAGSEVKSGRGVYLTISGGEELVEVPNLKGKSVREAIFNLEQSGLKIGEISYELSDEIFANTIIRQGIAPNAKVKSGIYIGITVSQGRATDKHTVPDVTSKTLSEAEKIFTESGFRIGEISYQTNLDLIPNTIIEQSPRAGELIQMGQTINLIATQKADRQTKVEN